MIQSAERIIRINIPDGEPKKKTILLVEDEAIIAFSQKQRLEKNGFRILPAYSAREAISLATSDYSIDLILMDIDLGQEGDGTDAALEILKVREIPIVFLSSHSEPEVVAKTEKITSYGYVLKDSGDNVLIASINMAFKLYDSHLRVKRSEESLKENQDVLEATLRSIGDGVISTDELGNITNMNPVAETLTGWNLGDALGEPIEKVFKVVNAKTKRRIRNPVDRILPGNKMHSLENDVILISKCGKEYFISETAAPIRSPKGYVAGSVLVFRDITKEHRLLQNLKESETRFRTVANVAPVMIWISGLDKKCNWFNQTWLDFTGNPMEKEIGDGWADGVHPDDIQECLQTYISNFDERTPFQMSYRLMNKKKEWRWIQDNGIPITDERGVFMGYIGSCVDITEPKIAVETLAKDLEERESLFKELQHRVKNSMSMIGSIIEIEANRTPDNRVREILENIVNRIHSVGNLYDLLYTSGNSHKVRLARYVKRIMDTLFEAFIVDKKRISVNYEIEDLEIEAKSAVPIGIIINELITNILKYAFPKSQGGNIWIRLYQENKTIHLTVSDDGVPFPEDFDVLSSPGLGLQLVQLLVRQLKGSIQWELKGEKLISLQVRTHCNDSI